MAPAHSGAGMTDDAPKARDRQMALIGAWKEDLR